VVSGASKRAWVPLITCDIAMGIQSESKEIKLIAEAWPHTRLALSSFALSNRS